MDFLKLVTEARTCRRFEQNKPLSQEDIIWLMECVRHAPSARNAQILRFISATEGSVLRNLFSLGHWAAALKDWPGPAEGERPTGVIATLMPMQTNAVMCYNVGIACQTIQLAAASRGWGSCIMWTFNHDHAANLLKVPVDMQIALLVWLGVAKEIRHVEEMPSNGSYHYWRDTNGVHHVPKRSVKELLIAMYN